MFRCFTLFLIQSSVPGISGSSARRLYECIRVTNTKVDFTILLPQLAQLCFR